MQIRLKSFGFYIKVALIFVLLITGIVYYFYTQITSKPIIPQFWSNQVSQREGLESDPGNLKKHVLAITSFSPPRNHLNLNSLNKTAEYIENEFKLYCPTVKKQVFVVNEKEYANIICLFGEEKNLIVIGAHYDVDNQSTGADDNASGVAGLLELARLLKEKPSGENITLVAYTLEELPYFRTENMGSFRHAQYLKDNNIGVQYMLSLEMIGYFSDEENSQKIPSRLLRLFYPSKGNFIAIIGRLYRDAFMTDFNSFLEKSVSIPVRSLHAPNAMLQNHSSDQLNYWKFGYDAAMVTDTGPYRNKNYHKVTDTPDTLDYESSAEVITGIYLYLVK